MAVHVAASVLHGTAILSPNEHPQSKQMSQLCLLTAALLSSMPCLPCSKLYKFLAGVWSELRLPYMMQRRRAVCQSSWLLNYACKRLFRMPHNLQARYLVVATYAEPSSNGCIMSLAHDSMKSVVPTYSVSSDSRALGLRPLRTPCAICLTLVSVTVCGHDRRAEIFMAYLLQPAGRCPLLQCVLVLRVLSCPVLALHQQPASGRPWGPACLGWASDCYCCQALDSCCCCCCWAVGDWHYWLICCHLR